MTKDEIKALIASKVAGQGTNIDAASVLPSILEGIIDLIPTLPEPYELPVATDEVLGGVKIGENLSITEEGVLSAAPTPEYIRDAITLRSSVQMPMTNHESLDAGEMAEVLGITTSQLQALFGGEYICIAFSNLTISVNIAKENYVQLGELSSEGGILGVVTFLEGLGFYYSYTEA